MARGVSADALTLAAVPVGRLAAACLSHALGRTSAHTSSDVGLAEPACPQLSPSKTREGVVGNVLGAAVGVAPFIGLLGPPLGPVSIIAIVGLVAIGALWGDLFESAVKRETKTSKGLSPMNPKAGER